MFKLQSKHHESTSQLPNRLELTTNATTVENDGFTYLGGSMENLHHCKLPLQSFDEREDETQKNPNEEKM